MRQRLALVHGHQGPWISTQGMTMPTLRVTGLKDGWIELLTHEGITTRVMQDGDHKVEASAWMRVYYCGEQVAAPICVIRGRAA